MKKIKKASFWDFLVVLLSPVLATFITVYFNTAQAVSLVLFFILPTLYLLARAPRFWKKVLVMILASVPFTVLIDYFAIGDGSWWVTTIFPVRLINGIPLEDFIWSASWFSYIVVFYEYFIDNSHVVRKDEILNKRWKKLIGGWYVALGMLALILVLAQKDIQIPYFYFVFGVILGLVPTMAFLIKYPRMLYKYVIIVAYFFPLNLLHEISALSTGQWNFPGKHFIGWVELIGGFRFPLEEFSLWMILGATYVLTWYEYFIDDRK